MDIPVEEYKIKQEDIDDKVFFKESQNKNQDEDEGEDDYNN